MAFVPGNPGGSPGGPPPPYPHHDKWAALGLGLLIGGPVLGKIARPVGGVVLNTLGKPVLKGFRNPFVAYGSITDTLTWMDRAILGAKVYQIVDGSSSQDLVQNGGPSAPPPLVQSGQLSDILSLGKISRPQSAHGRSSRTSATRRQPCPPGHRWNRTLGKCVPIRKR